MNDRIATPLAGSTAECVSSSRDAPFIYPDGGIGALEASGPDEALALVSAATTSGQDVGHRFREVRLSTLVARLLDMDAVESGRLHVLVTGEHRPIDRTPAAFYNVLQQTLLRYRLHAFFCNDAAGEHHRSVVPSAYNERTGEVVGTEMARWRENFRALAPEKQMIVATIIWLYQGGPDSTWLRRVPCTWRAIEALQYLHDSGDLKAWVGLLVTYPGW
jgi:hypothetical protein